MANEIRGNVYYIDSAGVSLDPMKLKIQSIAFAAQNTTSIIQLAMHSNTSKIIYEQKCPDNNAVTLSTFIGGATVNDRLFVKTLTAGTGFIYLG